MRITRPLLLVATGAIWISSVPVDLAGEFSFSFTRNYIDTQYGGNGKPGWAQAGDMDGDGDLDIVAGGGKALYVYQNDGKARGWRRFGSLDGTGEMGANGAALMDVDGDADLDVVCARYKKDLGWWENPGGKLTNRPWTFHLIDAGLGGWYAHDIRNFDLDGDGRAREVVVNYQKGYWNAPARIFWYRIKGRGGNSWEKHTVAGQHPGHRHCHAGLDAGDVDRDGHVDLAYSNGWFEAPDDPKGRWRWHAVGDVHGISNVVLSDVDRDSDPDLVMSAGHHGTGVCWYANPGNPATGSWQPHTIDAKIRNPEGLAAVDLDKDGRPEVVACELDFDHWDKPRHQVYVYLFRQSAGRAAGWHKQNIAPNGYASHQLIAVDINRDGRVDFISEGCGYRIVTYYENTTSRGQ